MHSAFLFKSKCSHGLFVIVEMLVLFTVDYRGALSTNLSGGDCAVVWVEVRILIRVFFIVLPVCLCGQSAPSTVSFAFDVGSGAVVLSIKSHMPLNDRQWHYIKAEHNVKEASLQVDQLPARFLSAPADRQLPLKLSSQLFVGKPTFLSRPVGKLNLCVVFCCVRAGCVHTDVSATCPSYRLN